MGWYWNPLGVLGVAGGVLGAVLACVIYWAAPRRRQNRLLALVLALEAIVAATGFGTMYLTTDRSFAFAAQGVELVFVGPALACYLLFLGTLDSPLSRPLRSAAMRIALPLAGLAWVPFALIERHLFYDTVTPTAYSRFDLVPKGAFNASVAVGGAIYLLALAVAISAYRRALPGTPERTRARAFVTAFGIRDVLLGTGSLLTAQGFASGRASTVGVYFFAATFVVYLPVLAYGMLKTHLFDLDVRIKWTVRRGTLALIFLGVFFVIAQLAQNFLSTRYGWAIGGVAAGLLLFAIAPLQRVAERVADAAMPLTQDRVAPGADSVAMFRAAVEMAYADGVVSRAEEKGLAKLAGMCGLSYERALGVREDVERALGLSDPHVKT